MSNRNTGQNKEMASAREWRQVPETLSIAVLSDELTKDPWYGKPGIIQDYCRYLKTKSFNSRDCDVVKSFRKIQKRIGMGYERLRHKSKLVRSDQMFFIHSLVEFTKLNTYRRGESNPTRWLGSKYVKLCNPELEIRRDEFCAALQEESFPPPTFFKEEKDKWLADEREAKTAFNRAFELEKKKENRQKLSNTVSRTPTEFFQKEERLKEFDYEIKKDENWFNNTPNEIPRFTCRADLVEKDSTTIRDHGNVKGLVKVASFIEENNPALKDQENVFYREGQNFLVKFNGKSTTLRNNEKYQYISRLLEKPGCEFHNCDLVTNVKGKPPLTEREDNLKAELEQELKKKDQGDINVSTLDNELTLGEYDELRKVACNLWDELKDARNSGDQESIEKCQNEFEKCRKYMFNEYGIKVEVSKNSKLTFRQMHRYSGQTEKARNLIKNHINNAIKDIAKELPDLAEHLKKFIIKKAKSVAYKPDKPTTWYISL